MSTNTDLINRLIPSVIYDTDELRRLAKQCNSHYFAPETLRYFGSRIGGRVFANRYFITSEQDPYGNAWEGRRRYSVRSFSFHTATRDDGREIVLMDFDTEGDLGQYDTNPQAVAAVKKLLAANN